MFCLRLKRWFHCTMKRPTPPYYAVLFKVEHPPRIGTIPFCECCHLGTAWPVRSAAASDLSGGKFG